MRHILIIISIFLFTSPLFGQSKPLGILLPPSILGNVSESRKAILLNTMVEEISKYFEISSPNSNGSTVNDVFQIQIIEEEGDTQLSLRWTSGDNRQISNVFCAGCKTLAINEKLKKLVGKLISEKKNAQEKMMKLKRNMEIMMSICLI